MPRARPHAPLLWGNQCGGGPSWGGRWPSPDPGGRPPLGWAPGPEYPAGIGLVKSCRERSPPGPEVSTPWRASGHPVSGWRDLTGGHLVEVKALDPFRLKGSSPTRPRTCGRIHRPGGEDLNFWGLALSPPPHLWLRRVQAGPPTPSRPIPGPGRGTLRRNAAPQFSEIPGAVTGTRVQTCRRCTLGAADDEKHCDVPTF